MKLRLWLVLAALAAALLAGAQDPGSAAYAPAEQVAERLREATGADCAWVAAGMVRVEFAGGDLATLLQFPQDDVSVVALNGTQIRLALERAVALYPSANPAFLQLAGITVTFSATGRNTPAVESILIAGEPLDPAATYEVAMPGSLSRGGLGYFTVWTKDQIVSTLEGQTIEQVVAGLIAQPSPGVAWTQLP